MRMRKKKNLDPRMEACASCWVKEPEGMRGSWFTLMNQNRTLRGIHVEIGCGKGRFTCDMAAANPDVLFIAIERVPDAMIIAMERAKSAQLDNIFFVDGDARDLPQYFLPDEVSRIYINFCDPWPGNRHSRRRLTHVDFLQLYRKVLKVEGQIHFKTDNRDLFEYSLFQFPKKHFTLSEVTRHLHETGICGFMTDYEEKFYLQGKPICRAVATCTYQAEEHNNNLQSLLEKATKAEEAKEAGTVEDVPQ